MNNAARIAEIDGILNAISREWITSFTSKEIAELKAERETLSKAPVTLAPEETSTGRMRNPVARNPVALCLQFAQAILAAYPSCAGRPQMTGGLLDFLTRQHTAFDSFHHLVNAGGNYFPSLHKAPNYDYLKSEIVTMPRGRKITAEMRYMELDALAIAYDVAQELRGDKRRAYRS